MAMISAPAESRSAKAGWWAVLALFVLMAALVTVRAWLVDRKVGASIACPGCFHLDVLRADLVVFAVLASLLLLASATPSRNLARVPLLLCGLMILVYVADLVIFEIYGSRLLMSDVAPFLPEGGVTWEAAGSLGGLFGGLGVLAGLLVLFGFLWWMPPIRTRAFRLFACLVLGVTVSASAFFTGAPYADDWAIENVFAANTSAPTRNRYSPETEAQVMARDVPRTTWGSAGGPPSRQRNVIVLMIESWSVWHSELFGGLNWTPRLDDAASRGLRFANLHSIGFSAELGLIGSLAGRPLWAPFLHWFEAPPFHSTWGIEDTLPAAFEPSGYHTAFLTPCPLDLHRKREWLHNIGFAEVEGGDHPFYENWPRFALGAAPDRALYLRAREWMKDAPEPWLLVLETLSTHPPYIDPQTGERSLQLAMQYADEEFGAFLDALDARGFLENGILVVISEHRSVTPMSRRELDRWGLAAHSLVPGFAIGREFEVGTVDAAVYSQSDLAPSFEWWANGEVSLEPFDAVMFDPGFEPDKCAFHLRSDRRAVVEVTCEEGRGQVMLDGDQTRFIRFHGLTTARRDQVLDVIARERIEAMQRSAATESGQGVPLERL